MRQLKLRVWGKSELGQPLNKFIYYDGFQDYNENDRMYWFFKYLSDQEIEFDEYQLFTGLKDKNGIDIYEGDICKFDWIGWGEIKDMISEIYWDKQELCFTLGNVARSGLEYIENLLVLGNIHENPELLKENK